MMRVLQPNQRVCLCGEGYESDAVMGTIETFHLYQDGSIAYTITWWDDRRLCSGTFFPTSFQTPEDPRWLEILPVVS